MCHLRKFSKNPIWIVTPEANRLAKVEMIVEKMHMKGHTDPWCRENCNAAKFEALEKVSYSTVIMNTSIGLKIVVSSNHSMTHLQLSPFIINL